MDRRIRQLAELLVNYSCEVKTGENVLIKYIGDETRDLVRAVVKEVYKAGGNPFIEADDDRIKREILLGANAEQLKLKYDHDLEFMKKMDCYIAVRGSDNTNELADVPSSQMSMDNRLSSDLLDYRVENTKWVVLRYPNNAMSQLAGTSKEAFEDFYFDVCTLDYAKMDKAMDALKKRMESSRYS